MVQHKNSVRPVSFKDFVQAIQKGFRNIHWSAPYHKLCHPCAIQYDYIVKLETQTEDAEFIVNQKLQGRGVHGKRNSSPHKNIGTLSQGRTLEFFQNLTSSQIQYLRKRHHADFDMFGYKFDENISNAKCLSVTDDGTLCC